MIVTSPTVATVSAAGKDRQRAHGNCQERVDASPLLMAFLAEPSTGIRSPLALQFWQSHGSRRRDMRLRRWLPGRRIRPAGRGDARRLFAPTIRDLNLRPTKYYQEKLEAEGTRSRACRSVGGDTLIEIADQHENRILVRTDRPGRLASATG